MKFAKNTQALTMLILLIIYLVLICIVFINLNNFTKTDTPYVDDIKVVIDAGHGGEDGGASDNGVLEKDINLSISLHLEKIFKANGYNVSLTRNADKMINTEGETLRERKVSDMKNRLELFNDNPNNIVISVHQNKFTQEKYYGTQIFYSVNNPDSKIFAEEIRSSVISLLQPDNTRMCKPTDSGIYLLNNATTTSIIVECGFLSNVTEAEKLKSEDYQKQLAFSIFIGFLNYYSRG